MIDYNSLLHTMLSNPNYWTTVQYSLNGKNITSQELVDLFNKQNTEFIDLKEKYSKLNEELNESNRVRAVLQNNCELLQKRLDNANINSDKEYKDKYDLLLVEYNKICELNNHANNTISKLKDMQLKSIDKQQDIIHEQLNNLLNHK